MKTLLGSLILCTSIASAADVPCNLEKYRNMAMEAKQSAKTKISPDAEDRFIAEACSLDFLRSSFPNDLPDTSINYWLGVSGQPEINDKVARQILYRWRTQVVGKAVPRVILNAYQNSSKNPALLNAVTEDATFYARKMANTDVPIGEVMAYSSEYGQKAFAASSSTAEYKMFKNSLEKVIVTVLFKSNPAQASVTNKASNTTLGSTEFKKPLDSGREYTFSVKKEGYETKEEKRYIAPTPKEQTIEFQLKKSDS